MHPKQGREHRREKIQPLLKYNIIPYNCVIKFNTITKQRKIKLQRNKEKQSVPVNL